MTKTVG